MGIFGNASRMSRQVLPPSTWPPQSPLHLPIHSSHRNSSISSRPAAIYKKPILQDALQGATFSNAKVRRCPYMSAGSGQCPLSDVVLFSVSPLFRKSPLQRECVWEHPRAHAVEPHGVISMECPGRLGSKNSGRVSSCICVHPRVLFLGRVPSHSSSVFRRLLPTSENSPWCTFLRVRDLRDRVLLPRLRAIRLVTQNNCTVIKK